MNRRPIFDLPWSNEGFQVMTVFCTFIVGVVTCIIVLNVIPSDHDFISDNYCGPGTHIEAIPAPPGGGPPSESQCLPNYVPPPAPLPR